MIPIKNFTPIGIGPELPPGYTVCEYLESTGTQWIDTGYKPNNKTQLFLIFNWVDTSNVDIATCYTQWDTNGRGISVGSSWQGGALCTTYVCNTNVVFYKITKNVWYESGSNIGGKAYVSFLNGELIKSEDFDSVSGGQFQLDFSIPLFRGRNRYEFYGITKSKIAKFSILENDVLIQNFIPALDPSGAPCMYDTVGKKPYYNQGTGTFSYKIKDRGSVYLYNASDFVKGECYTQYGNTNTSTFGKSFLDGKTHNGIIYAGNEPTGQYSPVRWTCRNYHILDHLIIGNDVTGTSAASVYGITDDGTYELIGEGPRWTGRDTIVMTKFKPYKKFEIRCHRPGWTNRVYVYWIDAYMRY